MLEDCVKYFKANKAYKRIFMELRKKWKKYGKSSGYIDLKDASENEREALKHVFGKTFVDQTIKFKVSEFEAALKETKYKGIGLQELLEGYFLEPMHTNKEENQTKRNKKNRFFDSLLADPSSQNGNAQSWLEQVIRDKKYGYNIIISEYEKNESNAYDFVVSICKAIEILRIEIQSTEIQSTETRSTETQSTETQGTETRSNDKSEKIRLAMLGANVTSNPHYFDKGQIAGKLLIAALGFIHDIHETNGAEDILELYYLSGIQPDDISSFTILYGISLYCDGGIHKAYESFIDNQESYMVNLSNLSKIIRADCSNKIVFIFENQMVFSHMCEAMKERSVAMICTSGQMKTASLLVIDLLCNSGCTLYYAGDLDPEGIKIADKVIKRQPKHIIPWRMSKEDYWASISTNELDEVRIKKMEKVRDIRLMEVVNELRVSKRAAYQEMLIEQMAEDIKKLGVNLQS